MPDSDDSATAAGATNVFLTQRSASVPYRREEVGIQGDENPWRALGFNAGGALTAISAAEMIEADPEAAQAALGPISESAFTSVDTEAEFDAALAAGRSMVLRGEGTGGVIALTTPKQILTPRITITGPGHLQFNGLPADARCLQILAPDVTFQDFELSSTQDLSVAAGDTPQTAIDFPSVIPAVAHRARFQRLDIHGFHRCVGRWVGPSPSIAPYIDDVLFEDCYMHVFRGGFHLETGFRRLTIRNCRVLGKQTGETHLCDWAAFHSGGDTEDILIEGGTFGMMPNYMGIEITIDKGVVNIRPKVVRTRVVSTAGFGISFGHCQQGYAEGVLIDDATAIGFEVAGDTTAKGRASATLVGCEVRNLKEVPGADPAPTEPQGIAGFTIDGSVDTLLLGCRANGIVPVGSRYANGIYVVDSDRAAVLDCTIIDAKQGVHIWQGNDYPNTGGFHVVQGCTFRQTYNMPVTQYSVTVADINAVVRNNTTFCRPGGGMTYLAACTAGAGVICDDTNPPLVSGTFTGSNRIIAVPA